MGVELSRSACTGVPMLVLLVLMLGLWGRTRVVHEPGVCLAEGGCVQN